LARDSIPLLFWGQTSSPCLYGVINKIIINE